jgi:hypothetical protein
VADEATMAPTIRMQTISRFMVFVASAVVWLILLTLLNNTYLSADDWTVVLGALAAGLVQTAVLIWLLRL